MSLTAILGRVRVVERPGTRFICKAPTLATVVAASGSFARVLAGLAHALKEKPYLLQPGPVQEGTIRGIVRTAHERNPSALGLVASTCVEIEGRDPHGRELARMVAGDVDLAIELAVNCLAQSNVPRLWARSGFGRMADTPVDKLEEMPDPGELPEDEGDPEESSLEVAAHVVAQRYGRDPEEIAARWPYERLLDALAVCGMVGQAEAPQAAESPYAWPKATNPVNPETGLPDLGGLVDLLGKIGPG